MGPAPKEERIAVDNEGMGEGVRAGGGDVFCLASLPHELVAQLWPPERVVEGLCVGNRSLTQALLISAPCMDLGGAGLGDGGAGALAGALGRFSGLRELRLDRNAIGAEGARALAEALAEMGSLEVLSMGENVLGAEGVGALCRGLPSSLRCLSVRGNWLLTAGAEALGRTLSESPCYPSLLTLDLAANAIGGAGAEGLRLPPALQHLDVSKNELGARGFEALARQLPNTLLTLRLGYNEQCGAQGAAALGRGLPASLQHLSLEYCFLGVAGAEALGRLPPALRFLNLEFSRLGAAGAAVIAAHIPSTLRHLDLRLNFLGASGASALARHLPPELVSLNLKYNSIGSAASLARLLPPSLVHLDLGWNELPAGAAATQLGRHLPERLQVLDVSGNGWGEDDVAALVEGMPARGVGVRF